MSERIVRYRLGDTVGYGLMDGDDRIKAIAGSPFDGLEATGETLSVKDATILAPVEAPRIFGVGLNYASHAEEMKLARPIVPMLFMKPTTAAVGPGDPIVYPLEGKNIHFEAEVAVVIGKRARRISEAEATDAILGYTCGNDVSERVIQRAEMAQGCLLISKGYDSFNPLGPTIATGLDPEDIPLVGRVNGKIRQQNNTNDLIFSIRKLVSYMSQAMTLLPGDVIMTGTPSGVGPIEPGDTVEIEVAPAGALSNPVVAEAR
jgi:2-keto-4-pentenoate hydratase/2-oxohepta-3-ene-1,7-dioic acid hydratase in catechol pathway